METRDLTLHDQVQIAAFRFFLIEVGKAPPTDSQEARDKWWEELEKKQLSPYTKEQFNAERRPRKRD